MNKLLSRVLTAGLIAGTLDLSAAFIYYYAKTGKNPLTILHYIASALFGKEAYAGGTTMLVAGALLHYIIAMSFTVFFFWLARKLKGFASHRVLTGVVYGLFVWAVMNLVVVPLSAIPTRPFNLENALINAAILVVCIGLPLSFLAASFYRRNQTEQAAGSRRTMGEATKNPWTSAMSEN